MNDNQPARGRVASLTIAVALIGLLGTSVAAVLQWSAQIEVERNRVEGELELARERFRHELLLRVTQLESEQDRRAMLEFYHKAGLVQGLEVLIAEYASEKQRFIPRSITLQESISEPAPAKLLSRLATTPEGNRPLLDQRVEEAVRLAASGQDVNRARRLLAEAGYPNGLLLEVDMSAYIADGGDAGELRDLASALGRAGIELRLSR